MRRSMQRRARTSGSLMVLAAALAAPAHAQQAGGPASSDTATVPTAATPAPAAPAAKPAAPAKVVAANEPTYKIKMTGRLQALYQLAAPDPETNEKMIGATYTGRAEPQTTSLFRIRRGRVGFEGFAFDPRYEFNVQLELAGSAMSLKRAYLNWKVRDELNVRAGKFKVPFGRQQLTSIFSQHLVDRSVATNEFTYGDDDGLMVWGALRDGVVEYYAGVFNGDGANRNNQQDSRNQWAGRAVWSPLGKLGSGPALSGAPGLLFSLGTNATVNGGWLHDVNGTPGLQAPTETCGAAGCTTSEGDNATVNALGADVALRWGRLAWTAEGFRRRIDPLDGALAAIDSRGWFTEGGVFLVPRRYEAGLRYGRLDPSTATELDGVTELSPFFNVYIRGNDLKVQTDFAMLRTTLPAPSGTGSTELRDSRMRVQLQLSF